MQSSPKRPHRVSKGMLVSYTAQKIEQTLCPEAQSLNFRQPLVYLNPDALKPQTLKPSNPEP